MNLKYIPIALVFALLANTAQHIVAADRPTDGQQNRQQQLNTLLLKATSESKIDSIKRLIKLGASPNCQDTEGNTPLCRAMMLANPFPVVHLLVELHADPTIRNDKKQTPTEVYKAHTHKGARNRTLVTYFANLLSAGKRAFSQFQDHAWRDEHFSQDNYQAHDFLYWTCYQPLQTPLTYAILHRARLSFINDMITALGEEAINRRDAISTDPISAAIMQGRCDVLCSLLRHRTTPPCFRADLLAARLVGMTPTPLQQSAITILREMPFFATDERARRLLETQHEQLAELPDDLLTLVLCTAIDGDDESSVRRLAPVCVRKNIINRPCEHMACCMPPLKVACLGSTPAIVKLLLAHGADPGCIVENSTLLRRNTGLFNQAHRAAILALFEDHFTQKAAALIAQEEQEAERAAMRAQALVAQRKKSSPAPESQSEKEQEREEEEEEDTDPIDFEDPDGNWVITGLAEQRRSSSPPSKDAAQESPDGSPTEQRKPKINISKYTYDDRVMRWIDQPEMVFVTCPEYQKCPESQRTATIMRHAACRIIDTCTARCCIAQKDEPDVVVALCPCLIIPDQGTPETRIFKCCVDLRTKSVFHRFFHKSSQAPEIFSVFHALPTIDEHAALAGAGIPHDIGPDGSRLLVETEKYIKYYDPRFAVTIYCAKPKQEAT